MPYDINKTDGTIIATVADAVLDTTTTSITLVGKNYTDYGDPQNENFVHMLEHFADTTAPTNPLIGQLWYDTGNSVLKICTNDSPDTWTSIKGITTAGTAPSSPSVGDLWFDTTTDQLKAYNGSGWIVIGPIYENGIVSGPVPDSVLDTGDASHDILKIYVADTLVAVVSDTSFTPKVTETELLTTAGFTAIAAGYNLAPNVSGNKFTGTATNADALGGVPAANYLRSNADDTTSGTLGIQNDGGLTVGAGDDLELSVSGANAIIRNTSVDGNLSLYVNDGGADTNILNIVGSTGAATFSKALTVTGTMTSNGAFNATNGATVTGNISVTGTVDGRDVSVDGAKLDWITVTQAVDLDTMESTLATAVLESDTTTGSMSFVSTNVDFTVDTGKLATRSAVKSYVDTATAGGFTMPAGSIMAYAGGTLPTGYLWCDGNTYDSVANTDYADLYTAIGTLYGGTGASSFKTPDLRGRSIFGDDSLGVTGDAFRLPAGGNNISDSGGEHEVTLSITEIPSHNHGGSTGNAGSHYHSYEDDKASNSGSNAASGSARLSTFSETKNTSTAPNHAHTVSSQGGGAAHTNMPPYLVMNWIIKY